MGSVAGESVTGGGVTGGIVTGGCVTSGCITGGGVTGGYVARGRVTPGSGSGVTIWKRFVISGDVIGGDVIGDKRRVRRSSASVRLNTGVRFTETTHGSPFAVVDVVVVAVVAIAVVVVSVEVLIGFWTMAAILISLLLFR